MTEPLFRNIHQQDLEINNAHGRASATISEFVELVQEARDITYMAKLRFRDPDLSEQLGEDRFLYMWLTNVLYHPDDNILSGVFFEVPEEMQKWHQVGERLGFDPEDVFDWMINDGGHVKGGFTIRVSRNRLGSEQEKIEYDEYIGISSYEPLHD